MLRRMTNQQVLPTPPPVSPYLTVADAPKAIDFYKRAFGASELFRNTTPDGAKVVHAQLSINGGLVMMSDDFPEMNGGHCRDPRAIGGTPVTIHLDLKDVDATWKQAVDAGAKVVMPLGDMFWGDRYGIVEDPFGHRWSLSTRKKQATQADIDAGTRAHFG
jgi:PhnB protein